MATQAHCAYCFETLVASFEKRQPLSLAQVEESWESFHGEEDRQDGGDDANMTDVDDEESSTARPAAISRLLNRQANTSTTSSSSSLPSTKSTSSSSASSKKGASGTDTPASSRSSLISSVSRPKESHPLFITWNTISRSGQKSLRGCIGTFEAQELEAGLHSYALTRYTALPTPYTPSPSH